MERIEPTFNDGPNGTPTGALNGAQNRAPATPVATPPRGSRRTRRKASVPPDHQREHPADLDALHVQIETQSAELERLRRQVAFLQRREETLRAALFSARDQLVAQSTGPAPAPLAEPEQAATPGPAPLAYGDLLQRVRAAAVAVLPPHAGVAVISRGDDELLALSGRQGQHFPQTADGIYAGFYPAESKTAIGHLESLRARGSDFLLIPNTAFWWLDHYSDFRDHLDRQYTRIWDDESCKIYHLEAK
jgi:hypothetical protein